MYLKMLGIKVARWHRVLSSLQSLQKSISSHMLSEQRPTQPIASSHRLETSYAPLMVRLLRKEFIHGQLHHSREKNPGKLPRGLEVYIYYVYQAGSGRNCLRRLPSLLQPWISARICDAPVSCFVLPLRTPKWSSKSKKGNMITTENVIDFEKLFSLRNWDKRGICHQFHDKNH